MLVLYPQKRGPEKERSRMDEVLRAALDGIDAEIVEDMEILEQNPFKYRGRRLLFAVPLGRNGINRGYYEVLAWLRGGDQVLAGATAGMIIDAESEFYTKATARELAVAANRAGCAFVGRPLVEGTASLDNYLIQAANMNTDRFGAYKKSAAILAHQILEETWQPKEESHLLVLHASNHRTSNTLAIWQKVKERLDDRIRISTCETALSWTARDVHTRCACTLVSRENASTAEPWWKISIRRSSGLTRSCSSVQTTTMPCPRI